MSENVAMNLERFAALADAYGAHISRWPDAERAAAAVFAETIQGKEILRHADELDALLDSHRVRPPSANLRAQLLRQATEKFKKRRVVRWRIGLAGVGFAGVIAGMMMVTLLDFSLTHNSAGVETTAFGAVASDSTSFEEED
jgi:anti-sigma factor RsiW